MGSLGNIEARTAWLVTYVLPEEAGLRMRLRKLKHADFDIDDIIQETYARLVQLDDTALIQNVRGYIYRVAHSVVADRLRRKTVVAFGVHHDLESLSAAVEELTPEDHAHGRNELRRLLDVVSELPDKTRSIFMLSRVQGLSIRSVSEQTGIPESTVEKHVARAMHHLLNRIADGGKSTLHPSRKLKAVPLGRATTSKSEKGKA